MVDLRVLGAVEVRGTGPNDGRAMVTQPKRLALLLYLALAEPSGFHSRERLLALLWPEADDHSSRHSLRNALHALRQALGDEAIVTRGESFVGLAAGAIRCDALDLRAHLAAGRLEEGLALWTGELAPAFHVSGAPDFEHWLDEQRTQLRRAVRAAAWKRARELAGAGQAEVDAVRRAARLDPGDEPGARSLMRLLATGGDRVGALRAYNALTEYLARELEAQPSAETQALAAELRSPGVNATGGQARPPVDPTASSAPLAISGVPIDHPAPADVPTVVPAERPRRIARTAIVAGALAVAIFAGVIYAGRPTHAVPLGDTEADRAVLRLPARYRTDSSAYRSYLRGLALRFEFEYRASRDTFVALAHREPTYVPGLYGLAHSYALLTSNGFTEPDESWPKAEQAARTALALDSTAASAWLVLAGADLHWHLDLARARERIARARMLDSLDPEGPAILSVWFRFQGQMDSAVAEAQHARALDPLSRYFERLYAKQLYFARRYEQARSAYARVLNDDPNWKGGHQDLARLYLATGHPRDAVDWYRRVRAAAGDSAGAAALPPVSTDSAAARLLAADAHRQVERLDRSRREGQRVEPMRYAFAYATLGDTVETLRWLDSVSARRDDERYYVRADPMFDFLRRDPRYETWEARSGLGSRAANGTTAGR